MVRVVPLVALDPTQAVDTVIQLEPATNTVSTLECMQTLYSAGPVRCLCLAAEHIVCGDLEANCKVRDPLSSFEVRSVYCHAAVLALETAAEDVFCGCEDGRILVFNVLTGHVKEQITAHERDITSLLLVDSLLLSGSTDGTIKVWRHDGGMECEAVLPGHQSSVTCLARHPLKLCWCFSASTDQLICLWDLSSCTCIMTVVEPAGPVLHIVVSPSGHVYSCAGRTIHRWTDDGALDTTFQPAEHPAVVYAAAMAAGWLFTGDALGTVRWWDANSGHPVGFSREHTRSIFCMLAMTQDHQRVLYTGSEDSTVRKWVTTHNTPPP
eukprot:GGOE01001589.1.p1 GENE.GGOE01001589.1~~GGOE01001589.1.p1  ORF type:complete len:336 (+),score=79.84 GGOE01001589.1:37-1008(+)